jgi:heme oxygenase
MNDSNLNEALKTIKDLSNKLDSLFEAQNRAINALPKSEREKLSFISSDIEALKKGLKNGDSELINTYLSKYARINTNI